MRKRHIGNKHPMRPEIKRGRLMFIRHEHAPRIRRVIEQQKKERGQGRVRRDTIG